MPEPFGRRLPATINDIPVHGMLYRRSDRLTHPYEGNLTASVDATVELQEQRDRGELLIYSGLVKDDGVERSIIIPVSVRFSDGPNIPLLEVRGIGPERAG